MRLRIQFSKTGALRYIGHLDLHKLWERSLRRADVQLMYSQGFHPQPKIQLAAALPLGYSSTCELVDIWVEGEPAVEDMPGRLGVAVPPGLGIRSVQQVDEKAPPLQTQVVSARFEVTLLGNPVEEEIRQKLEACLAAETLPRERRGKAYDLRPLIERMELSVGDAPVIHLQMAAREGATGRVEELLEVLGIPLEDTRIERTELVFK